MLKAKTRMKLMKTPKKNFQLGVHMYFLHTKRKKKNLLHIQLRKKHFRNSGWVGVQGQAIKNKQIMKAKLAPSHILPLNENCDCDYGKVGEGVMTLKDHRCDTGNGNLIKQNLIKTFLLSVLNL